MTPLADRLTRVLAVTAEHHDMPLNSRQVQVLAEAAAIVACRVAKGPRPAHREPGDLTPRERQLIAYAADGYPDLLIADELGLDYGTVRTAMRRARQRLGARNRAHAVAIAYRTGQLALVKAAGHV